MATSIISTFRSDVTELPPILTPQKSPKSPVSLVQHDSQSSVASSENKSSYSSDTPSSQSSVTESGFTAAGEKFAEAVPDTPIASTAPKKSVNIKYSLKVYDEFRSEWNTVTQDDEAFDLSRLNESGDKDNETNDSPPAIFEIITNADGFDKRQRRTNFDSDENPKPPPAEKIKLPPIKFEDLKVTKVEQIRMEIHSPVLLGAIRQVVDYYPNQNLSGDIVIVHEPYWVIIHHEKELRKLLKEISSPSEEHSPADVETAEHLKILLEFVQPQIDRIVPPIERRMQNKVPTITYDALWYLLKPGTLAYCQYAGEWIGCVIMQVKRKKELDRGTTDHWNIFVWFLSFGKQLFRAYTSSKSDVDSRIKTKHTIERYEGEKEITSLKVVPREYWDAIDNGARKEQFEARGVRKVKCISSKFQTMSHKGEMIDVKKRLV